MRTSDDEVRPATSNQATTAGAGPETGAAYIAWLEARSMLYQAHHLSDQVSGKHVQWRYAFAHPRPQDFVQTASVWFTSYPKSIVTENSMSVLQTLGDDDLLATLHEVGIEGIHMGPMKRSGGVSGRTYTPTIDGFFDRIELAIDPVFGTNDEYAALTSHAKSFDISIIGDLVPAHTGKGPDFRLAERAYQNYVGLYTMVEIPEEDWDLLGEVPEGADCVNLDIATVHALEEKEYIPGPLEVIPFHDPGVKDTNWSATDVVRGVDGRHRRWVYLHLFKAGQPSLNWLDPSFGAQRVIMADVVQSLQVFGATGLRLDANPLMGVERRPGLDKAWVEGHPLAEGGSNMIAMMIRKLGGFSFQEINVALDDLKRFTTWGPELNYDFVTRPPYLYAMATGKAGPLRLMLRLTNEEGLPLSTFVHALQNHDELMFDLSHLRKHGDEEFSVDGESSSGNALYERMYDEAKEIVLHEGSGMEEFSNLGFCGTLVTFAAAACGITDPSNMTGAQRAEVQRLHFLAAVFNAMQPGVFALSGWDLVGALLIAPEELGAWMEDKDYRWTNRGAYDLMGVNPEAATSRVGLPKAVALYGSLPDQLRDPDSFVSELKRMLRVRKESGIPFAKLLSAPEIAMPGGVVTLLERPDNGGCLITALNFAREHATAVAPLPLVAGKSARMIYSTHRQRADTLQVPESGNFPLNLGPLQGEVYVVE